MKSKDQLASIRESSRSAGAPGPLAPEPNRDGAGAERAARSPQAHRHDPPVCRAAWTLPRGLSPRALRREARQRLGDALLERALRHGGLALDGRPQPPGRFPERFIPAGTRVDLHALVREPVPVPLPAGAVLLDADGVVAVAKPPWMPTQRTRASARGALEARLAARLAAPGLRAVHRLDRTTSGVVLLARDAATAARLGTALREPGTLRRYRAWVSPPPAAEHFRVAGWLGRVPDPARYRFALRPPAPGRHPFRAARWSATVFRVLRRRGARALVEAWPETGRTHQIRVHLAAAGCPVVGDDLYGPPWREGAPWAAGRALLHAERLRLRLPGRTGRLDVAAPPPPDFPAPDAA